jgi:hypothetical protein
VLCRIPQVSVRCMYVTMVKLSLCLINYAPRHEEVWESGGIVPPFLTTALDWSYQLHATAALPLQLKAPPHGTHIGGWMSPTACLEVMK